MIDALPGVVSEMAGLQVEQVESFNSLDLKSDEVGLIELAQHHDLPFQTWSVAQLQQVETQLQRPSQYVFETVGVYGVAESAALWAAQQSSGGAAELVLAKEKNSQATCAIARGYCAKRPVRVFSGVAV